MNLRRVRYTRFAIFRIVFAVSQLTACGFAPGASGLSDVVTSSIELRGGQIILDASIGDSLPQRFMVDCGVDPSVIDLNTARRLSIPVDTSSVGEAEGLGDGPGLEIMHAPIPEIKIAGTSLGEVDALAADLSRFGEALRMELAGILGYSFFDGRVVRIDYPAEQISIARSASDLPPPTTHVTERHLVPLRFLSDDDPIPVFDVIVNGQTITVTLDTGSSGGIELFAETVTRLGLEEARAEGVESSALGARGTRTITKGTLNNVGVGPLIISELEVRYSERGHSDDVRDGNAGNRLLRNFVVTLDYVDRQVIFER